MLTQQLKDRALALSPWYHAITLFPGFTTESNMPGCFPIWTAVRAVRSTVDYHGRSVLDLGCMDGMWAFEAEAAGARTVIACDIYQRTSGALLYERFMLAREALGSQAVLVPNGDVHRLHERLDSLRLAWKLEGGFDVVQCLGLLYHVQHPLLALHNIRACLAPDGLMLLETACWDGGGDVPLMRGNSDNGIYYDTSTYWAPNRCCLFDMLRLTGFEPIEESVLVPQIRTERIVLLCRAVPALHRDSFGLVA